MGFFQIQDTLVSLDLIETFFCCDLEACKGQCCIEGDAGAPLEQEESDILEKEWTALQDFITLEGRSALLNKGVSYIDEEGDLVTTLIDGRDCAFSCMERGICLCALEKAFRQGKGPDIKPISCSLYPVRLTKYPTFTAVNYHQWSVCRDALAKGKEECIRLYEFLERPLTRRFGKEWYEELKLTAEIYLKEKNA